MKRSKMRRRVFYLDAATESLLREQAKRHGVSQGAIVRARVTGARPGATPGSVVAQADAWWDSRGPSRRVSVWRNHSSAREAAEDDALAGQAPLFDEGDPL